MKFKIKSIVITETPPYQNAGQLGFTYPQQVRLKFDLYASDVKLGTFESVVSAKAFATLYSNQFTDEEFEV